MEKSLKVKMFDNGDMEIITANPKTLLHCTEYVTAEEMSLFLKTMGCTACEQKQLIEQQATACCLRCYAYFYHNRSRLLDPEVCTCTASA